MTDVERNSNHECRVPYDGSENQNLHKISECVLESMNVSYGGDRYKAYEGGRPVVTNLSLNFKTLAKRPKFSVLDVSSSINYLGLKSIHWRTALFNVLKDPAMRLGSAFQKVNFLRDLKNDHEQLERSYFPNVDMNAFDEDSKQAIINEIEAEVNHDVIAFLTSVAEFVGPSSRFVHLGLTSTDVVDTALCLLLQDAGRILLEDIDELMPALEKLAKEHKHTLCSQQVITSRRLPISSLGTTQLLSLAA